MSTEATKPTAADTKVSMAAEETPEPDLKQRIGEGLGVFRALLLTIVFYMAFGSILWFAWHAFKHWRAH